jgi:hypothetical protein
VSLCGFAAIALDQSRVMAQTDLKLDHFKCYITQGQPRDAKILLRDQFDDPRQDDVFLRWPVRFCNPVEKRRLDTGEVTPILNPDNHLKMYLFVGSEWAPVRKVKITNQFGTKTIQVYQPEVLAVPTQKQGHEPPQDLDHFKCYRASGKSVKRRVNLRDQFHVEENVLVSEPFAFCNPTEKVHDGVLTPILNKDAHLTCYRITKKPFALTGLQVRNQFGIEVLDLREADLLCVPTIKGRVTVP